MVHPPLFLYLTKTISKSLKKMRENKDKHLLWFKLTLKTLVFHEYLLHLCFCFKQTKPKIVEYETKENTTIWF